MTILRIIFSFLLVTVVHGQDIITDRPDVTESPFSITPRTIQIESGLQYSESKALNEFTYPGALFRIGAGLDWEVRIGFPGISKIKSENYFNDVLFEAKYQITKSDEKIPLAILLVSTLPTGDPEVSVGKSEFGLKLAGSYDFSSFVGLGINIGSTVLSSKKSQITLMASMALGFEITSQLGAFAEFYSVLPADQR